MLAILDAAQSQGRPVVQVNPTCPEDVLTDRWPADLNDQDIFIDELRAFAVKLEWLGGDISLEETQKILGELFGEKPAVSVVKEYVDQLAKDVRSVGAPYLPGKASIPAAIVGTSTRPGSVRTAPSHNFFGDRFDDPAKR
jgi:hypothetical protein